MKKYSVIIAFCITTLLSVHAQDYKVNKSSGKLILNISNAQIEGNSGNDIVFISEKFDSKPDPNAKGLQQISSSGYKDNTGLGISVVEKGSTLEVNQVDHKVDLKILVPKNVVVSFVCHDVDDGNKIVCRNLENEISIEADYDDILLENISGPVNIKAKYGSITAVFGENIKGPVFLKSVHSNVDVAIPGDIKADLKLTSHHNTIMASSDLKIDLDNSGEKITANYGSSVGGKLNGGGTEFNLFSEYEKVYLRKAE